MSSKKTQQKKTKQLTILALAIKAYSVGLVVLAMLAAAGYVFMSGLAKEDVNRNAEQTQKHFAQQLQDRLLVYTAQIELVANDPYLISLMADKIALSHQKRNLPAKLKMKRLLDDLKKREQDLATSSSALRVLLIPLGDEKESLGDYPKLTYSELDLVYQTQSGGHPGLEYHEVGQQHPHFDVVRSLKKDNDVVGFVVASFNSVVVSNLINEFRRPNARLEISQLLSDGSSKVTMAWGEEKIRSHVEMHSGEVPGTQWRLSYWAMAPEWRVLDMSWRSFYWLTFAEIALVLAIMVAVFRRLTSELSLKSAAVFHEFVKDRLSGHWMGKTYVTPLQEFEPSLTNIQSLSWVQVGEGVNEGASVEEGQESGESGESYIDLLYQGQGAVEVDEDDSASIVSREVFRPYDIRGVAGKTLTAELVYKIGRVFATEVRQRGEKAIVVGRDGRLSGPKLSESLIKGLCASGCDVIDIGLVPTPMVYFATHQLETSSGIMVTGSHNPAEYNGLKMVMQGETLSGEAIQKLYQRVVDNDFDKGKSKGELSSHNIYGEYMARISDDVKLAREIKVVVDCGNGAAGEVAPLLLRSLGCEVVELYCDVDGNFPNHHPDPSQLENLKDLVAAVKENKADIGLAYDGDGDRLGVVDSRGQVFWPDRQMMLFAADVLKAHPGSQIIYDVKCSRLLPQFIEEKGGVPLMWQSGHSLLKAKLKETGAPLAGELSGHIFFKNRWFGFDDGLYAAARLLEILSKDERPSHQVFADLPDAVSTPEIRIPMNEGEQYQFMERLQQEAKFPDAELITIDGIRAEFKDGWGLVRASNTTPCLTLRFEADSEESLMRIQEVFKGVLLSLDSKLKLPF